MAVKIIYCQFQSYTTFIFTEVKPLLAYKAVKFAPFRITSLSLAECKKRRYVYCHISLLQKMSSTCTYIMQKVGHRCSFSKLPHGI